MVDDSPSRKGKTVPCCAAKPETTGQKTVGIHVQLARVTELLLYLKGPLEAKVIRPTNGRDNLAEAGGGHTDHQLSPLHLAILGSPQT